VKKTISAVMVCLLLGSSVQAQTTDGLKDRISCVAGLYARALKFYCHALAERNAGTIRSEAEPLLGDMLLELSRPEYRIPALRMRSAFQSRGQDDMAWILDLIIDIGGRDAAAGKMNATITGNHSLGIISDCTSFPAYIIAVLVNTLSNFIPGGSIFYEAISLIFAMALGAVFLVLWPLCLIGISAGEVIGFILCPLLGVCPP
jgi:hypothetical protein